MAKKEKQFDKEIFSDEHVILQFLSANKYKPKETLKAMAEHADFKRNYLPTVRLEKIENVLVCIGIFRKQGFITPADAIGTSDPSLFLKLSYSMPKTWSPSSTRSCTRRKWPSRSFSCRDKSNLGV